MSLLEARDVTVRYGGIVAVRGVSLQVEAGEVVALLGANGAGKSSLLNGLVGLVRGTSGSVLLEGREVGRQPTFRRARAGLVQVPEGRGVVATLTVEENLLLGAYTRRGRGAAAEALASVYQLFPVLEERRRVGGAMLSGGEQQMLAVGRAMAGAPRCVVLDEPSVGLSPLMVDTVFAKIRAMADTGMGVLLAEQNVPASLAIADRVYVLQRGEVVASGTAAAIGADDAIMAAFLGLADGARR
jgi:branched-chain amino acid transport system ATP-binding protein